MCDVQKTGKQDLSFGKRLEQLGLGQIIVLKIQDTGVKYNGGFDSWGISFYRMDLPGLTKKNIPDQ